MVEAPRRVRRSLPLDLVLVERERRRRVEVVVETNHVSHGADRKVDDEIHASRVHRIDELSPVLKRTVVRVQHREVDGGVACALSA